MKSKTSTQLVYEIRIEGELGDMWAEWFQGLSIRKESVGERGHPVTVLYGPIPDQPALHSVLNKIRDLNLTLISVKKCEQKIKGDSMKKAASIFSLFCGISMLAVWGFLLATGQVVELQTSPFQAMFLLGAELLTAVSLILGGFGLLTGKTWGLRADLVALGMLLYCTIFSIGVFGQAGNAPAIGFFGVLVALAAVFSTRLILESAKGGVQ